MNFVCILSVLTVGVVVALGSPVSVDFADKKEIPVPTSIGFNDPRDGSYHFSYVNADSHRKEHADSNLNVKGEYSFTADDGIRRVVKYIAGRDTGFVVLPDHKHEEPETHDTVEKQGRSGVAGKGKYLYKHVGGGVKTKVGYLTDFVEPTLYDDTEGRSIAEETGTNLYVFVGGEKKKFGYIAGHAAPTTLETSKLEGRSPAGEKRNYIYTHKDGIKEKVGYLV